MNMNVLNADALIAFLQGELDEHTESLRAEQLEEEPSDIKIARLRGRIRQLRSIIMECEARKVLI